MNIPKILVFTDCYIYGGCERLMSFLMRNETLNKKFILSLAYRNHSSYNKGMQNDYLQVDQERLIPLNLLSNDTLFYNINCKKISPFLKNLIKVPFYIFEKTNIYRVWNLIIFFLLLRKIRPELIHINNGGYPGAKSCNTLVWANKLFWRAKIIY